MYEWINGWMDGWIYLMMMGLTLNDLLVLVIHNIEFGSINCKKCTLFSVL